MDSKLLEIFNSFDVEGSATDIIPFGNGLINKTFLVKTEKRDYMLQGINSYVFRNVDSLMRNIYIVTRHLKEKGMITLEVQKTLNNKIYVVDGDRYYRLYTYIDDTKCYEKPDSPELAEKSGIAFGRFHAALVDLDPILIAETIPYFHDTPKRFLDLIDSVKRDEAGRLSNCLDELNFIMSNKAGFSKIMNGLNSGELPQRIVHNDPKINNILFDKDGSDVKCIIDLDTVMPGSYLFDYGDALRSLFTGDNESALSSDALVYDAELFRAYTRGYLSGMSSRLTDLEVELMPASVFTIAMELGIRFLADYIDGDKYFRISFPEENLVRARNQLHLAKDILKHMDEMAAAVKELS